MLEDRYHPLSQLYYEVEDRFRASKPPHQVWIDEPWGSLGFGKYANVWHLLYKVREGQVGLLIEAPLDIRIQAARSVPKLFSAIVQAKMDYVPVVDAAIETLKEFVQG